MVLSSDLVRMLVQDGLKRALTKGDILIREGDHSPSLFVVLEGQLQVFSKDAKGREVVFNVLGPGEIFGEMSLDGGERSASVRALANAECVELHSQVVLERFRDCPELAEAVVFGLIRRLRRSTIQVRRLALDSVANRTVACIGDLALVEGGQMFLPTSVTQQDIANRIGATREMVNHVFRDLVRAGVLVRDSRLGLLILRPLSPHGASEVDV